MAKYIDADALKEKLDAEIKIEEEVTKAYSGSVLKANAYINGLVFAKYAVSGMPAANVEPVSAWKERVNKALAKIKEIRLCDILHGHGACKGCGEDDWVCIAQKIEDIVSKMDGGGEECF